MPEYVLAVQCKNTLGNIVGRPPKDCLNHNGNECSTCNRSNNCRRSGYYHQVKSTKITTYNTHRSKYQCSKEITTCELNRFICEEGTAVLTNETPGDTYHKACHDHETNCASCESRYSHLEIIDNRRRYSCEPNKCFCGRKHDVNHNECPCHRAQQCSIKHPISPENEKRVGTKNEDIIYTDYILHRSW